MKKEVILDRIALLSTALLAAFQVVKGVDGLELIPMIFDTLAFGVLLVASLLLIILGLEALESPLVVIVSTLIPLSLSLGLVWEYQIIWRTPYLFFVITGFLAIVLTRFTLPGRAASLIVAAIHAIAGLTIFLLPLTISLSGRATPGFALVGVGGALIGIGGLLLSFVKVGKSVISHQTILRLLPLMLFLSTAAFVSGFALG